MLTKMQFNTYFDMFRDKHIKARKEGPKLWRVPILNESTVLFDAYQNFSKTLK